jgi:hypothetical protein
MERSIQVLATDSAESHVATIVETAYGAAQHYIAYGMQRHTGRHVDGHVGLIRALNAAGLTSIAVLFDRLDRLRVGHWYGAQGNGAATREALELLEQIKTWSLS